MPEQNNPKAYAPRLYVLEDALGHFGAAPSLAKLDERYYLRDVDRIAIYVLAEVRTLEKTIDGRPRLSRAREQPLIATQTRRGRLPQVSQNPSGKR